MPIAAASPRPSLNPTIFPPFAVLAEPVALAVPEALLEEESPSADSVTVAEAVVAADEVEESAVAAVTNAVPLFDAGAVELEVTK